MFPHLPSWDALHPLIVHFPVALLLVTPIFLITALALRDRGRQFGIAALILMGLGTIAAFVAVETGEAAAELAERNPQMADILERHADLAELTRNIFTGLTVAYAAIMLSPVWLRRIPGWIRLGAQGVFLAAYLGSLLLLVNTAHAGGRLVHEFGIRAIVGAT